MKSRSLLQQAPRGMEGQRKNRTRSSDKVAQNQVYLCNFDTSRRYTLPQLFQGHGNASWMAVVQARSAKKQSGCGHDKIVIATDAGPKLLLFKPDEFDILLMKDRYMEDWSDPWSEDRAVNAAKKESVHEKAKEVTEVSDSPGAAGSAPPLVDLSKVPAEPVEPDEAIQANSQAMAKVRGQKTFRSIRGVPK